MFRFTFIKLALRNKLRLFHLTTENTEKKQKLKMQNKILNTLKFCGIHGI